MNSRPASAGSERDDRPKVGLGLPAADPAVLLDWARRADAGPFSSLGLLDRLVYDNPEPLVTLAALATATSRIRLQTEVLIAPVHNTAVLAKQTATLDRIAGGRFTLGIGVGGREDDFRAAGTDVRRRGSRLDEQMALLRRTWAGEPYGEDAGPIGPAPLTPGGPEVLFGGFVPAALERVARWGDGFLGAGLPPQAMDDLFRQVESVWDRHGRAGRPRLVAQVNAVLGPDEVIAEARRNAHRYYSFGGDLADQVVESMLTTAGQIRAAVDAYTGIGADEVVFYCWGTDPGQVERLAETLF
ncbi:LLM class flavin-dependent oxidoreductase [Streptomyces gamaensis]|uniref:LLM class flavin-dependent oxidoreductase n=1 Tax=Streptomyces gamaensis TaxID=1763542 RepID=A0ABW0ZBL5_9ACTN